MPSSTVIISPVTKDDSFAANHNTVSAILLASGNYENIVRQKNISKNIAVIADC